MIKELKNCDIKSQAEGLHVLGRLQHKLGMIKEAGENYGRFED